MNGKTYKNLRNGWKVFVPIPGRGEASEAPSQVFPISTPNAWSHQVELLKLSDFVGTFIVHIVAKHISGNVSSGHQNRSRDPTSRVVLLKFEVRKPNRFSDQFQTLRVL